jgi:hypothetical protein
MLTSEQLKKIVTEARPLIEQQLDLTEQVAGLREVVTSHGGDWSQLKALVKAQIQDERDEAGDGKRVRKILDKADYAQGYADMLGLAKMNEKNSFASDDPADREARRKMRLSESMLDNKQLSAEMLRDGLISPEAHAENVAISDGVARKLGAGVIDPETGEIIEDDPSLHNPQRTESAPPAEPEVAAAVGSQPADQAEEATGQPGSSAPIQIEAPRGVEGEAEGASASPANFPRIPHMGTVRT